jgi:hypothetical protein
LKETRPHAHSLHYVKEKRAADGVVSLAEVKESNHR